MQTNSSIIAILLTADSHVVDISVRERRFDLAVLVTTVRRDIARASGTDIFRASCAPAVARPFLHRDGEYSVIGTVLWLDKMDSE